MCCGQARDLDLALAGALAEAEVLRRQLATRQPPNQELLRQVKRLEVRGPWGPDRR